MLKSYRDLKVWQKAYQLSLEIYRITRGFPREERYGLTSQLRRSAVSVPSNVAEGYGRKTLPDYIRCLYTAYGSLCELETQVLLSGDLGYLEEEARCKVQRDVKEVDVMLKALIKALRAKSSDPLTLEPSNPIS
jgi:four helix bundle protein